MFNSELVLKAISRRVFPDMGAFSAGGEARIGLWEVHLSVGSGVAWLTVSQDLNPLFRIEVRGSRVKATYALPAVVVLGNGEREYGTEWANSRNWQMRGWSDVALTSIEIREFFDNIEEFLREEGRVYEVLEGAEV